jgi:hypothetical protein
MLHFKVNYNTVKRILLYLKKKQHFSIDKVPSRAINSQTKFSVLGLKNLGFKTNEHEVYLQLTLDFEFPENLYLHFTMVEEWEPKTAKDSGLYLDSEEQGNFEQQIHKELFKLIKNSLWEKQFHKVILTIEDSDYSLLAKESNKRKIDIDYIRGRQYSFNAIIADLIDREYFNIR